eukprot:2025982-Pleurochrysis_carterae.AAC.1
MDGVVREMMNITDEMSASAPDAKKQKAMRTSVGWFSSPSCALIYQCAKYVALRSSNGYAIGAKFRQWLNVEQYAKEDSIDGELLGSVEDMLVICGLARLYVFFIDPAVTERFPQTGSLRTYREEEADLGADTAKMIA